MIKLLWLSHFDTAIVLLLFSRVPFWQQLPLGFSFFYLFFLHCSWTYWGKIISDRTGILFPKLFWPTVEKNCYSYQEKKMKFEAESREFAKRLRSLEQFIQTVKGQYKFWNRMLFNLFLEISQIWYLEKKIGFRNLQEKF